MVNLSKIMMLNWPLVLTTTGILYLLVLITLPFNHTYATIFLFAIIAFWSRLPGVGIPVPFYILYLCDVIDIFSILIAVNIGGIEGGIFSLFLNIWSRLCGALPPEWGGVISDSLSQFFACLVIPFLHVALGGNILITVTTYSIVRILFIFPLDQIFYKIPLPRYVAELVIGGIVLFAINIFYTKLFGNFINNLLTSGVQFNWILFLFTTIIILTFYITMVRNTESISMTPVLHNLTRTLRRRFVEKKRMKYEERERINELLDMDEIRRQLNK